MGRYAVKKIEYLFKKIRCLFVSDFRYRKFHFMQKFGYQPDMLHPKSFNEKIMYRMLQPCDIRYTVMSNKLFAREIVSELIGDKFLVPLLGVWDTVRDIPLNDLPNCFVLKCNHDCGSTIIVNDKKTHDFSATFQKLRFHLKRNMYYVSRERQYQNISPKIMCEEYLDFSNTQYKGFTSDVWRVHCFDGTPRFLEVEYISNTGSRHSGIYDPEWRRLPLEMGYPGIAEDYPAPQTLSEMLCAAVILSSNFDYCRIDFYLCGDSNVYFSEFTFSPSNGREEFTPQEWDFVFGRHWDLTQKP
ncbi:ATP-grasp fold amidoligase family protein [Yokenella regensburgei]|uniref:ATP-grasp fold amidoligase family protein n=1 Tax=Yokenella regensburgei TaxID=158877 RepID=UPI001432B574|nr:ATP-grasp fold amidoligase family protein [Yokenella regensburgei]QIU92597.1 glycosyltransferase [Yokenella regensburgei]